jgi:hypothetical protein
MSNYGYFSGNPQTEWLSEQGRDREMELLREFSYTDPDKREWKARAGSRINGASIPIPLWSTIGSPYTGDYRNASIVHDVACDNAATAEERRAADKMFYYACLAGGCSKRQARLLYLGVRIGAWGSKKVGWRAKLNPKNLLYRLETKPMNEEIEMHKTFNEIGLKLDNLTEEDGFDKLESLVDEGLK